MSCDADESGGRMGRMDIRALEGAERERERVVTQGIDSEDLSPSQQVPGSDDTDWLLLFWPASTIDLCRLRAGHVMLLKLPLNTLGPAAKPVVSR